VLGIGWQGTRIFYRFYLLPTVKRLIHTTTGYITTAD
jgi:hypothetical protein